jgi:MFS family permease
MTTPHVSTLLARGLLAGLLAALATFVFAQVLGEPQIDKAIAFEEANAPAPEPGHAAGPETVSRDTQSTIGLGFGIFLAGVALGGVYALVFAFANGRMGGLGTRATALAVAAIGFVVLGLVPFLKYPPNPPAVGDPGTIGRRTVLYLAMVALSVLTAVVVANIGPALHRRFGAWNGAIATGGIALGLVLVAYAALPGYAEVPDGFPPNVLVGFRLASIGALFVLWTALGLVFGALVERDYARAYRADAVPAL